MTVYLLFFLGKFKLQTTKMNKIKVKQYLEKFTFQQDQGTKRNTIFRHHQIHFGFIVRECTMLTLA